MRLYLLVSAIGCAAIAILALFFYPTSGEKGPYQRGFTYCMDLKTFNDTFGNLHLIHFDVRGSHSRIKEQFLLDASTSMIGLTRYPTIPDFDAFDHGFNIYVKEWFPSRINQNLNDRSVWIQDGHKVDDDFFEYNWIQFVGGGPALRPPKVALKDVDFYADITLLENSTVCCQDCRTWYRGHFKTNLMLLGEELSMENMFEYDEEFISHNPVFIRYVQNQTHDMSLMAVQKDAKLIRYVKNQTDEIKQLALHKDPNTLKFIYNQTHTDILLALKKKPRILVHVANQTNEYIELAVEKDGMSLCDVKLNQTNDMVRKALKQNRNAIKCVHDLDSLFG
jgi:hypothetical protein